MALISYIKPFFSCQIARKILLFIILLAICFALRGKNELDIKKCDAQIPCFIKNLRFSNEVRGNNRITAVIAYPFIIAHLFD